jgi:hypothetical protein
MERNDPHIPKLLPGHPTRKAASSGGCIPTSGTYASARFSHLTKQSTTPFRNDQVRLFRIIHPFHPLYGCEFELVMHRRCWGEDRVYYNDGKGQLNSLPASWTSAVAEDPFVVAAAGRSYFQVEDLKELVQLLLGLR